MEITFREATLEAGKLTVSVPRDQLGIVMGWLKSRKKMDYDLTVKEHRKKRSLDANAKLWALINELSVKLRIPPDEIYQGYIPDVGNNFKFIPALPEEVEGWTRDWCRGHIGRMVEDIGPCRTESLSGYRLLKLYRGSSEYDVPTFNRLLDLVIQDCKAVGIETLSERERSLLMEEWGKTQDAQKNKGA